jgi:hypothetical protein
MLEKTLNKVEAGRKKNQDRIIDELANHVEKIILVMVEGR